MSTLKPGVRNFVIVLVLASALAVGLWGYRRHALTKLVLSAVGAQELRDGFVAEGPQLASDVLGCSIAVVVHGRATEITDWALSSEAARRGRGRSPRDGAEAFVLKSARTTGTIFLNAERGQVLMVANLKRSCPVLP